MDTPPSSPSHAPSTQPPAAKGGRATKIVRTVLLIVGIVVFGLIMLGRKTMMGTKYAVSDKESVNYSQNATEDDARKLGEVLKAQGMFTGNKGADVLLKKDDKEGTVVSFVGNWNLEDASIQAAFKQIGDAIVQAGLGKPLTLRFLDTKLNKRGEIPIP
jgi:hypothetical protein